MQRISLVFLALHIFLTTEVLASPSVCEVDCKARSQISLPCGIRLKLKKAIKYCKSTDYPAYWACEAIRSTACKIGEAFEESGSQGPTVTYKRFQLLPKEKVFKSEHTNALSVYALNYFTVQSLSNQGLDTLLGLKVEPSSENAIEFTIQGLSDGAKYAGLVCTNEDYVKLVNNAPFYYLKQIDTKEFCRLRWQHLSNSWGNGFSRNRNRLDCEANWGSQAWERSPLTFTCASRIPQLQAAEREVDARTQAEYDSYRQSTAEDLQRFLENVNWGETQEVKASEANLNKEMETLSNETALNNLFEGQALELEADIESAKNYAIALEGRIQRTSGFIETYKQFLDRELEKVQTSEANFSLKMDQLETSLTLQNQRIDSLKVFMAKLSDFKAQPESVSLEQMDQYLNEFSELKSVAYRSVCEDRAILTSIRSLQGMQAQRLDVLDRLLRSAEQLEDTAEFAAVKSKLQLIMGSLQATIDRKNYIFGAEFESLKRPSQVCASFLRTESVIRALRSTVEKNDTADQLTNIYNDFMASLASIQRQDAISEEKTRVRDLIFFIMKELEDAYNRGEVTKLLSAAKSGRQRIEASGLHAQSVLSEEDYQSIQAIVDEKLAYFDKRHATFHDPLMLRVKLQNRLDNFLIEIENFKLSLSDSEQRDFKDDIENYLIFAFEYSPDDYLATIPKTTSLAELVNYDGILLEIEDKFLSYKELMK